MSRRLRVFVVGAHDVHARVPLLKGLAKKSFEVGAVGSGYGSSTVRDGIPFYSYSLAAGIRPIQDLRAFRQLVRIFREQRPDVVHAFDTKPGVLAIVAGFVAGVPIRVRTVTGLGRVFSTGHGLAALLRPFYFLVQILVGRATTLTVFQNPDDRRLFLSWGAVDERSSATVLGSGIDLADLPAREDLRGAVERLRSDLGVGDRMVVTMVSRIMRSKGVLEFLEAAQLFDPDSVLFLLVGPLEEREGSRFRAAVRSLERPPVRYLGVRNDVPHILALSDLFVLPTVYGEGVPRSLLEASASGVPVIATDVPGCREAVRDGETGWLVAPQSVADLVSAIARGLGISSAERRRMGGRGRRLVQGHFHLEGVIDAYAGFYRREANRRVLS